MSDLRSPLDVAALRSGLKTPWSEIEVVAESTSTNDDLVGRAASTVTGSVLVCEHQSAGHGRLGRSWVAAPRAGLTFSVLLRPTVARERWGWLALLAGLALRETAHGAGVAASLKWPNDLLVGEKELKIAGVLVQVAADSSVVIGIGLNVTTTSRELPNAEATSLQLAGAQELDRTRLLLDLLDALGRRYGTWLASGGDAQACGLAQEYEQACASIGRRVLVTRIGVAADPYQGVVTGVDPDGRLRLRLDNANAEDPAGYEVVVDAGDVIHVRVTSEP